MSDTDFYPLLANGADYPQPALSLLPQPKLAAWLDRRESAAASPFIHHGESFSFSRYALAEAMRRAGVKPGSAVLLPAFHCRAVVEPALYLQAEPLFYPVAADLSPDFEAMHALLEKNTQVVAMVLTHYFGFPNAVEESVRFCKEHGLVLIEDCAHALYGSAGGRPLGTIGSYSAASLWKFLPVSDGSVLLDNTPQPTKRSVLSRPVVAEMKSMAKLVLSLMPRQEPSAKRLGSPDLVAIAAAAQAISLRPPQFLAQPGLQEFAPAEFPLPATLATRLLAAQCSQGRVVQRRREHFRHWLSAVQGVPGLTPLYPVLADDVVPYAFPLLIDSAGLLFHWFKLAGIPMWRWEDMAVTDCLVAKEYRWRLIQLPCHQDLSQAEMQWLLEMVQTLARKALP